MIAGELGYQPEHGVGADSQLSGARDDVNLAEARPLRVSIAGRGGPVSATVSHPPSRRDRELRPTSASIGRARTRRRKVGGIAGRRRVFQPSETVRDEVECS